jgi:hypothetical protein
VSEENKRLEKLLKDSSFLNKQIERLIYELNTLGDAFTHLTSSYIKTK